MIRLRSIAATIGLVAAGVGGGHDAAAQSGVSADVQGGAEYTSNARLAADDAAEESDTVFVVRPSLEGLLERRGFRTSLRYTLQYWHYQEADDLDRALHDLDARAALTWWESVDAEVFGQLMPVAVNLGAGPVDGPLNNVQAARAGGTLAYRHEFNRATRAVAGYTGSRVQWLKVHDDDTLLPEYFLHDPGLELERDLGPRASVRLGYRYRLQQFDGDRVPLTGDTSSHVIALRPRFAFNEWLEVSAGYGLQILAYENPNPSGETDEIQHLIEARVVAGSEVARAIASFDQRMTHDVLGNPSEVRMARLGVEYTPRGAPWGAGLDSSWGSQSLTFDPAVAPVPDRAFVQARAALSYRVSVGTIEASATRFQSLEEEGLEPVEVNRFGLTLGGRF